MDRPPLLNFDGTPFPFRSMDEATAMLADPGSPFEMTEVEVRGQRLRAWTAGPANLRDVFVTGRAYGDRIFLVHEDERVDFEAFARATLALAAELRAHGIRKGDRVAIAMRNLPEFPVAFFASVIVGAIATPLNAWWTGPELEYALVDCGARFAVVDAERLERILPHLPACTELERVHVCRGEAPPADPRCAVLEELIGRPPEWHRLPAGTVPDVPLEPEDDATIFYTSGTTGKPKGAVGTHRNSVCTTLSAGYSAARALLRRGEPLPDPATRPQRSTLLSIPYFHTTGCQAVLCATLYNGGKLVTMRRWDVERAMALIESERINSAGGVPTIAWQILEHPRRAQYDLSSIESISYGGAPAASELVRRITTTFAGTTPGTGWGMTETSATFTSTSAEDYALRPDSCGVPLPVCDVRIADDFGQPLPVGEIGEVLARGPNVVRGYWNKPRETADTFVDGWVRTGDLGRVDEEGYLYIVDRKKDMLIRGGENIYCAEVEAALYEHPAVMDAAVVGVEHPTLGEEPAAVVALSAGAEATEAELQAFVATRLAAFKVPVRIAIAAELLPRNPNGKLMKPAIRRILAETG
ncbi:MAG: class I adenylate-forming enzyme family protein [Burkholderiaceae bacterium]